MFLKSGSIVGVTGDASPIFEVIVEDITERHRLQEQLRQAQKMEAIGHLAGGIAHDFNNLLTAILGYSELLTEQIGPDKPIGRDLREIMNAAQRAAALTQPLLAFSRRQVIVVSPLDLNQVIANLEPMMRRLLGEKIDVKAVLADRLCPVTCCRRSDLSTSTQSRRSDSECLSRCSGFRNLRTG